MVFQHTLSTHTIPAGCERDGMRGVNDLFTLVNR